MKTEPTYILQKVILYIIGITFFVSCKPKTANDQRTVFYYNESNGITSLDPAFARDLEIMWATNQLFDGLVELDDSLHVVPCIADSWEISDDGKTYIFHLRDSVFFHPSPLFADSTHRNVTAQDFVFSFLRILDPKVASPGQWIFSKVDNSEGKGFEALNDSTLVIRLKTSFQPFLGMLTTQYANVVPREVVEHYGLDFREHPIGTGPFRFAFWYENVALVFHKNNFFWQRDEKGIQLPYIDAVKIDFVKDMSVEYQGLLQGKYDFISGIHPSFKDELLTPQGELQDRFKDKIYFQKTPFIKTDYLGFMIDPSMEVAKNSPLLQANVRKALSLAINREEMIEYLRNNSVFPANAGFVPPVLLSQKKKDVVLYNREMALSLLKEAGFPEGKGLPVITLSTTADYADLMEYIQHEWEKIGVTAKIQVMQAAAFREAGAKGQLQLFRKSWLADYADPENFLSVFHSDNFCPNGPNYTHFSNTLFDQLYNESVSSTSDSLRNENYQKMVQLIDEQTPVIPLYYDQVSHFISKRIEQFPTNSVNMLDLRKVTVRARAH